MSSAGLSTMCFLRKEPNANWTFLLPSLVAAARTPMGLHQDPFLRSDDIEKLRAG